MKKHFVMMSAVLFGLLMVFASCKDSNSAKVADEEKQSVPQKISSAAELDDLDVTKLDLEGFVLDSLDLDDLDLDALNEKQANNLLALVVAASKQELPQDMGDGMELTSFDVDDNSASFTATMDMAKLGVGMDEFKAVMEMPELKNAMIKEMFSDVDKDMALFLKLVSNTNRGFGMKFAEKGTDKVANCIFTNEELKAILNK